MAPKHDTCSVVRRWEEGGYWYEDHDGPTSFHRITNRPPGPPEVVAAIAAAKDLAWRQTMWQTRR
jgi:hypothetical protein